MNSIDVGNLLGWIALYDNRKAGSDEEASLLVAAWTPLMADLGYDEALQAVRAHFRDSTDYLKPAHVRRLVMEIRAQRQRGTQPGLDMDTARRLADNPRGYIDALRARERAIIGAPAEPKALEAGR